MALFKIYGLNALTDEKAVFYYDNQTSSLVNENGDSVIPVENTITYTDAEVVSKDLPGKKKDIKRLKISLGLECNYECTYCNQRFVPHADSTNLNDITPFIESLDSWLKEEPEVIEFWGGEPLVYWKTLKPLAEALRAKFPNTAFSVITNGSLLDDEKNGWLETMGFNVGLSHDGPGYHARGQDPLNDPEKKMAILDLWYRLGPKGRMTVNAMMHKDNTSRGDVEEFLVKEFGENVSIGEGAFIDPYDEGGVASSLQTVADQYEYRNKSLVDLRNGKAMRFQIVQTKIGDFIQSIATARPASSVGQKCSMDRSDNMAVDLNGNVITCQNVSAISKGPNGENHKIGHVSDFDNIAMKTSTHWSQREECPNCPVLQICKGSCMFLDGPLWESGCDNAFSDNIPFFAGAIEVLTGFLPYYIEGPHRRDRFDVFGLIEGIPKDEKKIIPITPV
jgi:uncharacterized protein